MAPRASRTPVPKAEYDGNDQATGEEREGLQG